MTGGSHCCRYVHSWDTLATYFILFFKGFPLSQGLAHQDLASLRGRDQYKYANLHQEIEDLPKMEIIAGAGTFYSGLVYLAQADKCEKRIGNQRDTQAGTEWNKMEDVSCRQAGPRGSGVCRVQIIESEFTFCFLDHFPLYCSIFFLFNFLLSKSLTLTLRTDSLVDSRKYFVLSWQHQFT